MATDPSRPIVGFPREWEAFFQRHPSWLAVHRNLHHVIEKLFNRAVKLESPAENIIFFIGRLCVEDFNETFLLAGNGYGFGSQKMLRGLYERIVTMAYLAMNQDEAPRFLEYNYIHRGKLIQHAESFFGNLEDYIDKAEIAEAKCDFNKYKDTFVQTKCKKCKTKTIMHSWSKLDLASMAEKTGFKSLYFPGYYYPTLHAHATAAAVGYRLKDSEVNPITFEGGAQPEAADQSLIIAHNLIIRLVHIQSEFFKLDFAADLELLSSDFKTIWGKESNGVQAQKA